VVEYPWWQDLPAGLGYDVHAWDAEHGGRYHRQLATAPGWKVGGWPAWPTTDAISLLCNGCGSPMTHLLQIDSGEWGDPARWQPSRRAAFVPEPPHTRRRPSRRPHRRPVRDVPRLPVPDLPETDGAAVRVNLQ
jgi:hypothetical protein